MARIVLGIIFGVAGGYFATKVVETIGNASAAALNSAIAVIGR